MGANVGLPPFFLEPVWTCLISLAHSPASIRRRQLCKMHVQPALLRSSVAGSLWKLGEPKKKITKKNVHIVFRPMWVVYATGIHRHHNDHTTIRIIRRWSLEVPKTQLKHQKCWQRISANFGFPQVTRWVPGSVSTSPWRKLARAPKWPSLFSGFYLSGSWCENTNGQAGQQAHDKYAWWGFHWGCVNGKI